MPRLRIGRRPVTVNDPKRKARYGSHGTTGAVHELMVAVDLVVRGYEVFRAVSPSCSCDLIALKGGKALRVEVKTGYLNAAGRAVCSGNTPSKYDLLAVVTTTEIQYTPSLG
jgi:hypothetical protein